MRRQKTLLFIVLSLVLVSVVHAESGQFIDNFIPSSITKSLDAIQVFVIDFLAFILDIFTILLFILLVALIFGIVYLVYYLVTIPKKLGVNNIQEAIMKIAQKTWEFMK